jgi:hypothetical protein
MFDSVCAFSTRCFAVAGGSAAFAYVHGLTGALLGEAERRHLENWSSGVASHFWMVALVCGAAGLFLRYLERSISLAELQRENFEAQQRLQQLPAATATTFEARNDVHDGHSAQVLHV